MTSPSTRRTLARLDATGYGSLESLTTLTVEQFRALCADTTVEAMLIRRMCVEGLAFTPVRDSDLYRHGVTDMRVRGVLYRAGLNTMDEVCALSADELRQRAPALKHALFDRLTAAIRGDGRSLRDAGIGGST